MVFFRQCMVVLLLVWGCPFSTIAQMLSTGNIHQSQTSLSPSINQAPTIVPVSLSDRTRSEMLSGWEYWYPYQFEKVLEKTDERVLTGLDIKLANATLKRVGIRVNYKLLSWEAHQKALEIGENDMASAAFINSARQKYAWFSDQYRHEVNVLYVAKGMSRQYNFYSVETMLRYFKKHKFRLGVVKGYAYASPIINDYLGNADNQSLIVPAKNEMGNFRNLRQRKIDGFLIDRIVGATIAWRNGLQNEVEEHPGFLAKSDVHFMFSKKTVSKSTVNRINEAIKAMKQDGSYKKITEQYLFPVLLNMTIESHWFSALDIVGTIAFALSGLIIAAKEHYSITGAFVLASLPAVGGGVIRDLLVSRHPIGVMRTPIYLLLVMGIVTIGYIVIVPFKWVKYGRVAGSTLSANKLENQSINWHDENHRLGHVSALQFFDAIGLAAFTITGATVAVEARLDPLWMWAPLLAAMTSSGGGILRDIMRSSKNIATLKGVLYPEISVVWGVVFYVLIDLQAGDPDIDKIFMSVLFVLLGTFITRMAAMLLRWRSLVY